MDSGKSSKRSSIHQQTFAKPLLERRSSKKSSSNDRRGVVYPESFKDTTIRTVTSDSDQDDCSVTSETVNVSESGSPSASSSMRPPESPSLLNFSSPYYPEDDAKNNQQPNTTTTPRPRLSTLDRQQSEGSPLLARTRNRLGSINTSKPQARTPDDLITSIGFPSIQSSTNSPTFAGQSTSSPTPSYANQAFFRPQMDRPFPIDHPGVANSQAAFVSPLSYSDSSKILQLMKVTCGRMHGILSFRSGPSASWVLGYCAINVASGSLIYQAKGEPALARSLIPDLRGCRVRTLFDTNLQTTYLSVSTFASGLTVQLRPHISETFDSWLAALLCWQPIRPKGAHNKMTKPQSFAISERRLADRRRNSDNAVQKDAAIIKVGKMLLWDKPSASGAWPASTGRRASTYRQQKAISSPSWRRVSCTLQENGHFKLFTESDVTLLNTIYLNQLSRCAVQQLEPSILEDEFCIAIYPQYAAHSTIYDYSTRPIYLSLESRVLFEVWFVLLRAFTIPELYGPKLQPPPSHDPPSPNDNLQGMFRIERQLRVMVIEARLARRKDEEARKNSNKKQFKTYGQPAPVSPASDYYAEVLLDGEIGAKTAVKYRTASPFWREDFTFHDLPSVLSQVSIAVKTLNSTQKDWSLISHGSFGGLNRSTGHALDGVEISSHDITFGKVDFRLEDLEPGKEVEKWWPIMDERDQPLGEMFMKTRLEETVVLMSHEYQPMSDLLHSFSNGLTLQMSQLLVSDLNQLSETLLNIYQVSGQAREWISALVEDEIDGVHKESSSSRLKYTTRIHSNESRDSSQDREVLVRDLGRTATVEVNLLFRGNSLLTKALDLHMRRLGKEYLDETVGERLRDIEESDLESEVDPSRVPREDDLERNWRNLASLTEKIWSAIASSANRCPPELRLIFRHIRACAEDRYGDFLRTVTYSSVSGFLFLRFFCPAILNPKLFGLLKGMALLFPFFFFFFLWALELTRIFSSMIDHPHPRAQRTLTLIAKALQGLANMSTFGHKEPWMEPMNKFVIGHRAEFKEFVDAICSIPADRPTTTVTPSYTTPIQILGRLPPTSREGFPSLPFLIDLSKNFAVLTGVWLKGAPSNVAEMEDVDPAVVEFHNIALRLRQRTREYMSQAEQAERPSENLEVKWEELLDSMERCATFHDDDESVGKSTPSASEAGEPRPPSVSGSGSSHHRSSIGGGSNSRSHTGPKSSEQQQQQQQQQQPQQQQQQQQQATTPADSELETPSSSSSTTWEQKGVSFSIPRWADQPRESMSSSKNSSTYSLDNLHSSKGRRSSMSKDSSSRSRFFSSKRSKNKDRDRDASNAK